MGMTERETQQLLNDLNLDQRKELVTPSPRPHFHNVDVPVVGSRFIVPNSRIKHDVPVLGAISTLRELQRLVALLRARLSELNALNKKSE